MSNVPLEHSSSQDSVDSIWMSHLSTNNQSRDNRTLSIKINFLDQTSSLDPLSALRNTDTQDIDLQLSKDFMEFKVSPTDPSGPLSEHETEPAYPIQKEISELPADSMLSKMNLGKLWQWILCICTVNFDLDKGQDLESVYPPLDFTNAEKKNMYAYSKTDAPVPFLPFLIPTPRITSATVLLLLG